MRKSYTYQLNGLVLDLKRSRTLADLLDLFLEQPVQKKDRLLELFYGITADCSPTRISSANGALGKAITRLRFKLRQIHKDAHWLPFDTVSDSWRLVATETPIEIVPMHLTPNMGKRRIIA